MSFNPVNKGVKNDNKFINRGLRDFKIELEYLKNDVELYSQERISLEKLQQTLRNTRNSFKEVEFFVAYYYPEFTKTHLNAAPLFHIEAAGTSAYTLPPEGLQVLDELIFSDEASEQKEEISTITNFLYNSYANFYLSALNNGLSSGNNKTLPLRIELIRIYSLGVTGFDTPGSLNISEEAAHALKGMSEYINDEAYFKNFKTEKANLIIQQAITYLGKNTDFESFDRIQFYKEFVQPLYAELGSWDGNPDDLKNFSGWNVSNKDFFKADFFDPYFYTILKPSEDSEELKNLGEKIFYDQSFSANEAMSCASCHLPENAYTDLKQKSASNVEGKTVLRNSPSLYNAVFAKRFFYDMRAFYLEQQAEHVIYNQDEFNTDYQKIVQKLNGNKEYKKEFKKVFKDGKINKQNFSKALSSFVASLYSFESDFDRFMRNEKEISEDAKKGYNLFMGKANCATCHFAPHFSGLVPPFFNENESEVLGVTKKPISNLPIELDGDRGRINSNVKKENSWIYENSFKTMTVRNIALTKPYFHNGAFNTLEEVIDFYNEGGGEGLGLPMKNQTLPADKLNLTEIEKKQLISFLNTLTDISKAKKLVK
ncbi:Cytochrome c551 peroxidase precursor [Chryseobacterium sp. MOF25P]|uniref:cytochrome-c peroxidase n=1 Tax=unclassified Chryseobacterium TaxID=2593645 RepID=UPI000805141B|nr:MULTISPECIES: cytochrome c peroxidase [unclassified Chryseobacterium]OBW40706.1 Cytochrome c551 peroxidase precursor [Chryseobacterium sp. MOF25P]OBW45527.1 Cytochrome c551 peroxidase precursor [Chryseobacterium sp. BGARF1]